MTNQLTMFSFDAQTMEKLDRLMSMKSNFRDYRELLYETQRPAIPFLYEISLFFDGMSDLILTLFLTVVVVTQRVDPFGLYVHCGWQ